MTEPDNHLMPSERNAPGWKLVPRANNIVIRSDPDPDLATSCMYNPETEPEPEPEPHPLDVTLYP